MDPVHALRQRLSAPDILLAPGIFDALSATLAVRAGFEALFLSGSALAATQLARPDIGLLGLSETVEITARIADRVDVPILVDADQGFGNAFLVARTTRMLESAGAAAIQIEDQLEVKSPARPLARPVIPTAMMVEKIAAAKSASQRDLIVSARTDAIIDEGFESALDRAHAYVEAGADMLFVEGLTTRAQMQRLVAEIDGKVPLLHNLLRPTDEVTDAATAQALGYRLALFPAVATDAAAGAMDEAFRHLLAEPKAPASPREDRIGNAAYLASPLRKAES